MGKGAYRQVRLAAESARRVVTELRERFLANQPRRLRIDPLTGALNGSGFIGAYDRLTRTGGDRVIPLGLILVSVDQAVATRDLFGVQMAQTMLSVGHDRIRSVTGRSLIVARIFGDEFVIIAPHNQSEALAHRIANAMATPALVDGVPLDLTGSIGVALRPRHGIDLTALIPNALEAGRVARQEATVVGLYEPRPATEKAQRTDLVRELQRTLTDPLLHNEIEVLYQPQVSLTSGLCTKVEALMRWRHPELGEVSPQLLIEAVEPTALMHALTTRIIHDVAHQLATWNSERVFVRAAINVSMRDLNHRVSLAERVIDALERADVPHSQVELEVTEGALVSDSNQASLVIAELARVGIPVSIDDFGTGYASLLYVRQLPVRGLKIDRGLIQRIAVSEEDRVIVRAIIDMGEALGIEVIAEGVEDDATHNILVELRCPLAQGWYYAPPMNPDELVQYVAHARAARARAQSR